ncbi:hypothetical protein B0293_04640 [Amycolatopsis azurea DSM 43854]|uniref:Nudix hydrolase domain-containing protein n=2 Tax=Amycolatopsis azurea TaxID=36819 RepID=A0ABX3JLJ2_9PSEU|nr:hypothetical protein B0293_04640 [Amycolatopsis azurea DSM 43854]
MRPEDQRYDASLKAMQKVGAVIISNRKVMVVRKKNEKQSECIMPGGRMEEGETQYECLVRELNEELKVDVGECEFVGTYRDIAVFEGVPLVIHAYHVEIKGTPRPSSEIKEYIWINTEFPASGLRVASIMARKVMPEMKRRGLID